MAGKRRPRLHRNPAGQAIGMYAVLEVDAKYSPKLKLYSLQSGSTGTMKVKKPTFNAKPLKPGHIFKMERWQKKPAYQYVDGKAQVKSGVFDLWLVDYSVQ